MKQGNLEREKKVDSIQIEKMKYANGSCQAFSKRRPTQLQEQLQISSRKAKRSHDLAKAVQSNTQSSKKSGAQTVQSKTKHMQMKRQK